MGKWEDLKKKWGEKKNSFTERYRTWKENRAERKLIEKQSEMEKETEKSKPTQKSEGERASSPFKTLLKLIAAIVILVLGIIPIFNQAWATGYGEATGSPSEIGISSGPIPLGITTPISYYVGDQIGKTAGPALVNLGNTPVGDVPLKLLGSQVGCWFGKAFVPSEVIKQQTYSPTQSWDECKKLLVKEKADEIGCTNCYSITSFKLETLGVQQAVMSLTIDTPEGKQYCRNIGGTTKCEDLSSAKNPKVSVLYDSSKATLSGVKFEEIKTADGETKKTDNIIVGNKKEISPLVFPLDIRALIPLSCTTKGFTPKAIFSYDYQAYGSASLSLRQESITKIQTVQNPVTFPGPIKLDVIPRPKDFAFDRDAEISVTIVLRNAGNGEATINNVYLKQNPPLQFGGEKLIFRGCAGPYSDSVTTPDSTTPLDPRGNTKPETIKIPSFVSVLGKKQESNSIICSFVYDDNVKNKVTDISTFSFEATADYTYKIIQKAEAVSVEEVLTCDVPTTDWKVLQLQSTAGDPPKDGNKDWKSIDYTDSGWNSVNLPDIDKCSGCTKYYRKMIIPLTGQDMFLSVASDDGAVCYLINKDGVKNLWSEDAIDDRHSLGKSTAADKIKYGCDSQSSFDYCAKLNNFNLKGGEANIIACKVKNKLGEDIGFAISTDSKIYGGSSQQTTSPEKKTPEAGTPI